MGGVMMQENDKKQGFVILGFSELRHKVDVYLSKIGGEVLWCICESEKENVLRAIRELAPLCWRLVLILGLYPKGHAMNDLVEAIKTSHSGVEVVRLPLA